VAPDVPVGFKEIRLNFDIETSAPQAKLDELLAVTERYCVIFQTIQSQPATKARVRAVQSKAA
ncbi:MAG: OsmC family protein, partial [Xanthobacteraceae bacterium]